VTGISSVTAIAVVLGTLVPMIAAGTFLISLQIRPDRSPLQATFDFMWDKSSPNRLQRWYVPLIGAAIAGMGAELLRLLVSFARVGARPPFDLVATAAAVGVFEGVFLALALALGFGVGSVILTPRSPPSWLRSLERDEPSP
jgi:hypothetical protein